MKVLKNSILITTVFALGSLQGVSQIYSFDDGTLTDTTGQISLAPFNIFGSGQLPPPASGTIAASEGVLNLSATHFGSGTSFDPTILGAILGPTRIGVLNPVPYADFEVSVEITDTGTISDGTLNPTTILAARITNPGPGTTSGYGVQMGLNLAGDTRTISLVKIVNESPIIFKYPEGGDVAIAASNGIPNGRYKIIFTGRGSLLTVFVDDLETENPGLSFSFSDSEFTAGISGIIVAAPFASAESSVSAKYDNFVSRAAPVLSETPPLTINPAVLLSWPMVEGNVVLESARSLRGPWRVLSVPLVEANGMLNAAVVRQGDQQYFRLTAVE